MVSGHGARVFLFGLVSVSLAAGGCLVPPQQRGPADPQLSGPVARRQRRPRPADLRLPVLESRVLPSGLRVMLERDVYATAAGVVSVVEGGAGADPAGQEGLAHLVEHLTYAGVDPAPETPLPLAGPPANAVSAVRISRREKLIRYAAVLNNGLTSPDSMLFYEFGPTSRLRWLVELEGARLAEPLAGVSDQDVAFESGVITHEHQLRGDTRNGVNAMNELFPMLFPAPHPYARPTAGTPASRERLTLGAARAYVAKVFRPERMTLLVTAGITGVDLDTVISWLPKALVGDAAHPTTRPVADAAPAPADTPARPVIRRPSSLPVAQLWIAWTLPAGYGSAYPTEELLARWVEDDLGGEQVRQEEPHIRQTAAILLPGAKGTVLAVRLLLDEGADANRVMQVVSTRVGSLWTREKSEVDLLSLIRARVASEVVLDEQVPIARAAEEAQAAALGSRPRARADVMAEMTRIQGSELAKFAYENLGAARARGVLFTPSEEANEPVRRSSPHTRRAAEARSSGLLARAAAWDPLELPGGPLPEAPVTARMPSGLNVVVDRRHSRAVTAWLVFHGGYSDATPPLIAELALRVRPEATDAPRHLVLPGRGATPDASIETVTFRPVDLEPALELLFTKATASVRARPSEDALNRLMTALHAGVDAASEKANQAFQRALFGDHPLSHVVDTADLKKVTRSEVDSWIGRVYNVRKAALIVVGDVDPEDVYAAAASLSRKFNAPAWLADVPVPSPPALRPAGKEHVSLVVTPRRGGLTEVRLGCLLPHMGAADRCGYALLRLAMKERLATSLRFERGDSYDLDVGYDWLRGGVAALQIATFLDASDLADGLAVLHENWRRWGQAGFDDGELNAGRWELVGERTLSLGSNDAIAYYLFKDWSGDPLAIGKNTFRADPLATRPARLGELFATCRANAVLGLTGSEAAIREALAKAWPEAK